MQMKFVHYGSRGIAVQRVFVNPICMTRHENFPRTCDVEKKDQDLIESSSYLVHIDIRSYI
jgi:hypothetical protein